MPHRSSVLLFWCFHFRPIEQGQYHTSLHTTKKKKMATSFTAVPKPLSARETQVVLDWNYNELPLPPHKAPQVDETVGHVFEQLVKRFPSRLALVAEDNTELTYRQVLDKTSAIVKCLLLHAPRNEETGNLQPSCVLVALQRTAALPISLLAVVRSGLTYWGVDMVLQSAAVVLKNMKALNVRTVIVDSDTFQLLFPDGAPDELSVLMVAPTSDIMFYRSAHTNTTSPPSSSAYLCPIRSMYIEFTSGSTGQPKAVAVPHKAAVSYLRNSATIFRWGAETRSLLYHSVSFDLHVHDLWGPWCHGGSVIVVNVPIADANGVWERGRDTSATHLSMTPFGFKLFTTVHLRRLGRQNSSSSSFISGSRQSSAYGGGEAPGSPLIGSPSRGGGGAYEQLQSVMLCGEALDMSSVSTWLMDEVENDCDDEMGSPIPSASPSPVMPRRTTSLRWVPKASYPSIVNCYGITETTVVNTFLEITPERLSWPSSIGRRLPHTVMLLLDEARNIVPHGQAGEIFLTGDCLASGYITSTEKNDSAFVPIPPALVGTLRAINPAMGAAGSLRVMYKTGDVAVFQDRYNGFVFTGRSDSEIKSGGFRVNPVEVEEILNKRPEIVKQAVVVAALHPDGRKVMFACIVPSTSSVTKGDVRARLREVVAEYKVPLMYLLPMKYVFPVTASNKVDRVALSAWGSEVLKLPPNAEAPWLP